MIMKNGAFSGIQNKSRFGNNPCRYVLEEKKFQILNESWNNVIIPSAPGLCMSAICDLTMLRVN